MTLMALTLTERLKLARDDYDQQEKLYTSLVLGQRFYIGISVILCGASISLSDIDFLQRGGWTSWLILATACVFWICLFGVMYQLFRTVLGEPWAMPRSVDHYFAWKAERLKQIGSGKYATGEKSPEEFAEDEMLCLMSDAYAVSTSVNREGNLNRQSMVQRAGKLLLCCLVALGLQSASKIVHSLNHGREQRHETSTTAPAASGTHRHE